MRAVFWALPEDADMENMSMDSTCIKVYEALMVEKNGR